METSTYSLSPRRWRIVLFTGLMLLAQSAVVYLLSWVDPPRAPLFVPLSIRAAVDASAVPFANALKTEPHGQGVRAALASLARHAPRTPVIVYLAADAVRGRDGRVYILPADGRIDDTATWLPLGEVLAGLKASPAKQKLLVLDLTPPAHGPVGLVEDDFAAALPAELDAVPDGDRLVLSACGPDEKAHASLELGRGAFAHYFHEALRGHADGYVEPHDGRVSVRELAAFVKARVERWSVHNRGAMQTPMLHGAGGDFTLVTAGAGSTRRPGRLPATPEYPPELLHAWRARDDARERGQAHVTPQATQWRLAMLMAMEKHGRADASLCERMARRDNEVARSLPAARTAALAPTRPLAEPWRNLEQQLSTASPTDAERIKKRFVEDMRDKLPEGEADATVLAHLHGLAALEPGTVRLCDQLLHAAPTTVPRSEEALRVRLLADLALRVEVQAWPRDIVESLVRAAVQRSHAVGADPHVPGYAALLNEPALVHHEGEIRLWSRGYASLADAGKQLNSAAERFERLHRLNEKWRQCEHALADTLAELPWYLDALDVMPELREPWRGSVTAAQALADCLAMPPVAGQSWQQRVDRQTAQADQAERLLSTLTQARQTLHAPIAQDALVRLERQCRSPHADAATLKTAEALLSVAPLLKAEDRAALWNVARLLARRLNDETLALDHQDNEAGRRTAPTAARGAPNEKTSLRAERRARCHLSLFELAGLNAETLQPLRQGIAARSPGLHDVVRRLAFHEMPSHAKRVSTWHASERLAWLMPATEPSGPSPTVEHRRRAREERDRWLAEHRRYLAGDYQGFNLETAGMVAARTLYRNAAGTRAPAAVRMDVSSKVAALTPAEPYVHLELDVTRHVPPGAAGPVELRFHCADEVWLEVAPASASLPALVEAREPRTLTHKVPLKVIRRSGAERTGLPPPIGFLVEARFEGRSYHRLVTVPVIPSTQELQILVSEDGEEPSTTLNEIRIRPGKVKQPYYVYVKNLTNRTQKVHVDVKAGETLLRKNQKLLTIEADGVRRIPFDASARVADVRGALEVRVLDAERQKVLAERAVPVAILSPRDYVRVTEARYEPAGNKWTVQLEATRPVPGPAIAAQLVLPMQRIPGLVGIGGGTLQVELPAQAKSPRTLFAERLRLVHGADQEGPVYLNIDGVPRAFAYRTTFARNGSTTQPAPDHRPAVRIVAPPCVMAGIQCLVDVEVDNPPPGSKLEVALGRVEKNGHFTPEVVREFAEPKKRHVQLEATSDALVLDAAIRDWTAKFDTRAIVGARDLRARLLDAAGKEIVAARQSMVIDDSPPLAAIAPTAAQARKGSLVQLHASGADAESGVAQVLFFVGRPEKGEIPLAVPRFTAIPTSRERTSWQASVAIPADHRGPLAISVHVVNNAGLANSNTVVIDVTDHEPGKTGLGVIRGIVREGQRVQPNVLVTLHDEAGKEIARTRTQADGGYLFQKLPPGRYRVNSVKPESQRRATMNLEVRPDQASKADLSLAL